MTRKFIAIIQTGQAIPSALREFGDFNDWFIQGMGIDKTLAKTYRVFEKLNFPRIDKLAGIIVTGSGAMVTNELDWSEATINWLQQLLDKDIPVLGVCYGHQLLAKALGGIVDWNPKGRQIGQVNMLINERLKKDLLFKNIIDISTNYLKLIATHQQSVIQLPNNVALLGYTDLDPNHAFRYKKYIWGLQFHPEFTTDIIKCYIKARSDDIEQEGLSPETLLSQIHTDDLGKQLLQQFRHICFHANPAA